MRISVLGAGNIGKCVANNFKSNSNYKNVEISIGDISGVNCDFVDTNSSESLEKWLIGSDAVICCLPYYACLSVAQFSAKNNIAYFDLTESIHSTSEIKKLKTNSILMPQCGLAPGAVSIISQKMVEEFKGNIDSIEIRVGALPLYPNNKILYYLTWSTAGLINEYCNPCDTIIDGQRQQVLPLEGYEEIVIDGITYEAFNTSGGLGTLCDNLNGNIRKLDYKTMRYKGHHQHMVFLLKDLNLANRKEVFVKLFDEEIPKTKNDVVVVYVKGIGRVNGVMTEKTYVKKIYGDSEMSAIQKSTSFGVCAVVDLWAKGKMKSGFVCQENVSWEDFSCNEWGSLYNFNF